RSSRGILPDFCPEPGCGAVLLRGFTGMEAILANGLGGIPAIKDYRRNRGKLELLTFERILPTAKCGEQSVQFDAVRNGWTALDVVSGLLQNRNCTHTIARRVVMKSHRHLHQPLQERFLFRSSCAPGILQNLVGGKEVARVEELDGAL